MKELNNDMKFETPAVAALIDKMMEQGTTYEEYKKVLVYALSEMEPVPLMMHRLTH